MFPRRDALPLDELCAEPLLRTEPLLREELPREERCAEPLLREELPREERCPEPLLREVARPVTASRLWPERDVE